MILKTLYATRSYTRPDPDTQRPDTRELKWICKYCKSKNDEDDNNCPHCGAPREI